MENIEKDFNQLLQAVTILQTALNVSFSEALTETFDNLETNRIKVDLGAPDQATVTRLSQLYQALDYDHWRMGTKVKVFTLLSLKAVNEDGLDANQMPTPPAIATVMALIMNALLPKTPQTIVDPAIGTGNLLFSVVSQLATANHSKNEFKLVGIDNDEKMLNLADVAAHLQQLPVELYCQDALTPWMTDAPAVVVSDLPIGYYPIDENAAHFATKASKGHSLAHYLLTEQIIKNLQPAGWGFLLVPKDMITGRNSQDFMSWLSKKVFIKALIELPDDLFKNKFNQKEILVFQNHGDNARASEVLLTKIASLKNENAIVKLNVELHEWYTKNYR